MQRRSGGWPFRISNEDMPYQSDKEKVMLDPRGMLTLHEAEIRARRGADQLEEVINKVDKTPEKRDDARYAKLTSLFMEFLAERHGIAAPDYARTEIDRE